jgi:glucokinase
MVQKHDAFSVGFDIGGTNIKIAVLTPKRGIHRFWTVSQPRPLPEEVLATIDDALRIAGHKGSGFRSPVRGVGVGCAGLIDANSGSVIESPNLPQWKHVPLADLIHQRTGLPTTVRNDADVFALAEWKLGTARKKTDVVFVTLGTGVGGALLINGHLYHGAGFAGELGHATVKLDGPRCSCGNRGCLESLVGSGAIVRRARRYLAVDGGKRRKSYCPASLTPELISDAARHGEQWAVRTFAETGRILGIALAGLANTLSPELFVIGGGVSRAGTWLFRPARDAMIGAMLGKARAIPRVLPARLGNKAGAVGAALFHLEDE